MRKGYDVSFKLKAIEYAEKKSKEVAAHEFNVDLSLMSVIKGCAKCMFGNKRLPGVDAWPCLNAGVQGVLKEINTRAFIPGNTVLVCLNHVRIKKLC